ncbi:speckle-type POZ protein [Trichonephila inaurata madagascariensis]|uniref:Speckle-type POZ protein n=1 Tax=Trichonephila inaurata madagascariensis TaxID=2747483 RepID=A0A8X7C5M0_9ARAC|nr:speckle-type POZ protein [Trichonephila inaurata madagascariensis]
MNNSFSEVKGTTLETVTDVDVSKDTLIWTVNNFSVLQQDPNLELLTPTLNNNSLNKPRWGIKIKKGDQFAIGFFDFFLLLYTFPRDCHQPLRIELSLVREDSYKSLPSREMFLNLQYKNEQTQSEVCRPVVVKIVSVVNTLINSWTSTDLTIKCVISYNVHSIVSVKENGELLPFNLRNISSFEQFYLSERLSDFSLKVDDEVLPVHQIVLSSHSSVFAAMIESDMKENHERCAVIFDIPSSVLKDMLHYMYCGMVEDLTPKKAVLLYEAADIYNLQHLKEDCAVYLSSHTNDDVSANVLRLANLYNDKRLETAVRLLLNRKNE